MLQNRINELNSGILNFMGETVFVTGFMHEDRLKSFYERDVQCFSSKGLYALEVVTFNNIKDHALFLIQKDGVFIEQQQFNPIHKGSVRYKNKPGVIKIKIRKNTFNNQFNLLTERDSLIFDSKEELVAYLKKEFVEEIVI